MGRTIFLTCGPLAIAFLAGTAAGQQATIGVSNRGVGASFYENIGVQWGVRGNGWFFNFGGGGAQPPFGGFDPNAGATFGFAGPGGFFNLSAGQGASTTFGSQTPMVTMPNGGFATFNDQTLRPFVTGIVPVVGGAPPAFSTMLEERLHRLQAEGAAQPEQAPLPTAAPAPAAASSAERGDVSVAEIKARKAAEKAGEESAAAAEVEVLLEKARGALADGKRAAAKIFLQMATRRAGGEQRAAILRQLESLK